MIQGVPIYQKHCDVFVKRGNIEETKKNYPEKCVTKS